MIELKCDQKLNGDCFCRRWSVVIRERTHPLIYGTQY